MTIPKKYRDLLARAAWTALQGAIGVVAVPEVAQAIDGDLRAHLPVWLGVALPSTMALLSAAKSWAATRVGSPETVTFSDTAEPAGDGVDLATVPEVVPTPAPLPDIPPGENVAEAWSLDGIEPVSEDT